MSEVCVSGCTPLDFTLFYSAEATTLFMLLYSFGFFYMLAYVTNWDLLYKEGYQTLPDTEDKFDATKVSVFSLILTLFVLICVWLSYGMGRWKLFSSFRAPLN